MIDRDIKKRLIDSKPAGGDGTKTGAGTITLASNGASPSTMDRIKSTCCWSGGGSIVSGGESTANGGESTTSGGSNTANIEDNTVGKKAKPNIPMKNTNRESNKTTSLPRNAPSLQSSGASYRSVSPSPSPRP